jgi:hypothetical protein
MIAAITGRKGYRKMGVLGTLGLTPERLTTYWPATWSDNMTELEKAAGMALSQGKGGHSVGGAKDPEE